MLSGVLSVSAINRVNRLNVYLIRAAQGVSRELNLMPGTGAGSWRGRIRALREVLPMILLFTVILFLKLFWFCRE